jgi:uncharacterized membrane protein
MVSADASEGNTRPDDQAEMDCKRFAESFQIGGDRLFDDDPRFGLFVLSAIARDGAGVVEVSVRLQKALGSLASIGDAEIRDAAKYHGRLALKRS